MVSPLPQPLFERPPTPPRESSRKASGKTLADPEVLLPPGVSSRSASPTNKYTPSSSFESAEGNTTAQKQVKFSHIHEYQESPPISNDGRSILGRTVQPLPPSAERKPRKSILKASLNGSFELGQQTPSSTRPLLPAHHHTTFAEMLESICQQLAGRDRGSKLDAYLMLSDSLKASDNIPDVESLEVKMGLMEDFIKRDQTEKDADGRFDSQLAVRSLQVLSSFLQKAAIARLLSADFAMYIVELSIRAFEDGKVPKEVIKNLLFVLAYQNFSAKTMSQERVIRLLNALHGVDKHYKGKSIITGRINAYRTLIRKSRNAMLTNTVWLDDLFSDMVSDNKATRSIAVEFGFEASVSLGSEDPATRAVLNVFKVDGKDGEDKAIKFADLYAQQLKVLVKKPGHSQHVPQIFSVIMLFIRSKRQIFDQWQYMKSFLAVLQLCFNSSDKNTKIEANKAWDRLVFAVSLDNQTTGTMRKLLSGPIASQLRNRKSLANRGPTFCSVYNLLYYSLGPRALPAQLDKYWDEFVALLVGTCMIGGADENLDTQRRDAICGSEILGSLFDSATQRTWSEMRAVESLDQKSMEVTELPGLDPKWLRKNSDRVFSLISPLLQKFFWSLAEDNSLNKLWSSYLTSIASPAEREVKVSIDTMSSLASIFSFLHRIWKAPKEELGILSSDEALRTNASFLSSVEKMISIVISKLGVQPLTEKQLAISQDNFVAIVTPSHQPKKIRRETRAPLHHLIILLTTPSPGLHYDRNFSQMVQRILSPFFQARVTSKLQMELVQDLLNLLPVEGNEASKYIWPALASFAASAADMRDDKENSGGEQLLGTTYRSSLRILELGITLWPEKPPPGWKLLFDTLATSATLDAGEAGKAIAIIEPLAKTFVVNPPASGEVPKGWLYYPILLAAATYPKDKQALDAAKRRVWGTGNIGPKTQSFDPYSHLYEYIKMSLGSAYSSCSSIPFSTCIEVITPTLLLIDRCPSTLLMGLLQTIQESIGYWIMDRDKKLVGFTPLAPVNRQGNTSALARLLSHITLLWSNITTKALPQLVQMHSYSEILNELEPLLCSGFESKHRAIVNETILFWNSTFKNCKDGLEYPTRAKETLLKIHSLTDIVLPFFPESLQREAVSHERQPIEFVDSQAAPSLLSNIPELGSHAEKLSIVSSPSPGTRMRQYTPQVLLPSSGSLSKKRLLESTPDRRAKKSRKRNSTPRVRHDDSQIQFEAIESSPMSDRIYDSQLLTDKQKEVRERQQADAEIFSDLRSSASAKSKRRTEPDLPPHRSNNAVPPSSPSLRPGQTTPSLLQPSDDDSFLASSPTPRPLQKSGRIASELSLPGSATKSRNESISLDIDPSSSPPRSVLDFANDKTTSCDPSRQNVPNQEQNERSILSTFKSTNSPACYDEGLSNADHQQSDIEAEAELPVIRIQTENQPTTSQWRSSSNSPGGGNSPKFVDALTSPALSDNVAIPEQVPSPSAPSAHIEAVRAIEKATSSPLSEIDESSIMRMMTEYDQGPGSTRSRADSHNKENEPQELPTSPSKSSREASVLPELASTSSTHTDARKRKPLLEDLQQSDVQNDGAGYLRELPVTPSLIPETPGLSRSADGKKIYFNGIELDPEETVIFDPDETTVDETPIAKRGTRRTRSSTRSPSKKGTSSIKKRKRLQELDPDEVPDSQEANVQLRMTRSQHSVLAGANLLSDHIKEEEPQVKRRRRKRTSLPQLQRRASSRLSSRSREASQAPSDQTSRSSQLHDDTDDSVMLDSFMGISEEGIVTAEDKSSDSIAPGQMGPGFSQDNGDVAMATSSAVETSSADMEALGDTTVDQSSFVDESSLAKVDDHAAGEEETSIEVDVSTAVPPEEAAGDSAKVGEEIVSKEVDLEDANGHGEEVSSPQAVEEPAEALEIAPPPPAAPISMLQSMKQKLYSLIGELSAAALGRREVHELEDMFMDAKRELYDAELRGRHGDGVGDM